MRRLLPACAREAVPDAHLFVAANLHEGNTLANVLIGSGNQPSTVVRVTVAPGDRPLSVFVIGCSGVIWDFAGDVARVQRVMAMSSAGDRRVAVRGIAAARVEFVDLPGCALSLRAQQAEHLEAQKFTLSLVFGRRPDLAVLDDAAHEFLLPDGAWRKSPDSVRIRAASANSIRRRWSRRSRSRCRRSVRMSRVWNSSRRRPRSGRRAAER